MKRTARKAIWLALVAAAIWLAVRGAGHVSVSPPEESPPATVLRLREPGGKAFDLSRYRGRVVLVNLWASWCGPCRAELPRLRRVERDLRDRGLVVLGLNLEGHSATELDRIRSEWGISYPVVVPDRSLAGTTFEGEGVVPHNWWIDREGRLRASRAGLLSERTLRRVSLVLLDEARSDAGIGNVARVEPR